MRIPVPEIQRNVAPDAGPRPPLMSPTGMGGVIDAGNSLIRAGEQRAAVDAQQEQNYLRSMQDQARARNIERAAQARLEWTQTLQQRQEQADPAAEGFTAGVLKDFEIYRKQSLDAIPDPAERMHLNEMLAGIRDHIQSGALSFEATARRTYRKNVITQGIDTDAATVSADPSQAPDVIQQRRHAIATSNDLSATERQALDEHARNKIALFAGLTMADRTPDAVLELAGMAGKKAGRDGKVLPSDPAKAAEAVANDPLLSNLSPEGLRQVIDRATLNKVQRNTAAQADAERRARQAEIEANRRARAADQAWAILSGRAMTGVATDPKADAPLFAAIAGTPYAKEYTRLAAQVQQSTATAMLPLGTQQAQIDQLIQQRNASGTNTNLEAEIKFRKEVLSAAKSAYEASPLRATQQYGLQNLAPLDTTSLDGFTATIGNRVKQAALAGQQVGKAASPVLPEEAQGVARMFAALPPDQFGAAIARLSASVPAEQMQALAQQIGPHDKPTELAFAVGASGTTQGRTVAELIKRGAQVLKDKSIKLDQGPEFGIKPQIAKAVGEAVPQSQRENIIDAATLIYAAKQGEGNTISTDGAVRLAIGGDIVEHNGRRLAVPVGVNLPDRLAKYPAAAVAAQAPDGFVYIPTGQGYAQVPAAAFTAGLPGASLEPAGAGRYMVRIGGGLAINRDRRPITVTAQ